MKQLRKYIRRMLTESVTDQAGWFFSVEPGFEQMSRRDVPSGEQLPKGRGAYYGRYVQGNCQTIFQIEERDWYDFVNGRETTVIWIHGIRSTPPAECQGKGMGSHVMRQIMSFADAVGIGVAGDVVPYGSSKMTREDMTAFDARFGLMPLKHWEQFADLSSMEEEYQYMMEDYIEDHPDWVWRPAAGTVG